MFRLFSYIILLTSCSISLADDWIIVPSNDSYWMKTINPDNHELLIAYNNNEPYFLLIITSNITPPDKPIPIWLKIDRGLKEKSQLHFLKRHPEQSIFRIEINADLKKDYIARMIAGLKWSIYFNADAQKTKIIEFSLKGFTVAFNDLLIANDIGSLDPKQLEIDKKDTELFCYFTSNITVQALNHRLRGDTYSETLHGIPKTNHISIDRNLTGIVTQAYKIPKNKIPAEPATEKYNYFKRCMKNIQQNP